MPTCLACSSQVPADSRFCPRCGSPLTPSSEIPTNLIPSGGSGSSGSLDEGRFTAGTILAGRYRIIGLLGRGGMGEVYRADDLMLIQAVALKFLPEALAKDPARLARFLAEVRIARTISHPNVCRVYDIGEVDGRRFLSMEFVDGEDLSSLLRRIGRFAPDKATEIARQICAGLAAAHDKGVVHRDLKPANVMIDGQGKVRITDFGLAGLAADMKEGDVRVGTPAYMAPEQLSGKEVTVRSDLYALGLILYEMYTGKTPFKRGSNLTELIRDRQEQSLVSPGTLVSDLDPAIDRAILRCLEKDPRQRSASALAVAASLPGGDPLAAALAAGETPAPEVVAAAGEEGGLAPRIAWMCLMVALLSIAVAVWLTPTHTLVGKVRLGKSPAVLQDRAEEILKELGHTAPAVHAVRGFVVDDDYLKYLKAKDASATRWDALSKERPAALSFWYRQSPRPIVGYPGLTRVTMTEPPQSISGMATVALDPRGRLLSLEVVPPQVEESTGTQASPDWPLLFREAGLDVQSFTPVASTWTPPTYADTRAAWEGEFPETHTKIRVEAASFQGRPVYFRILGPWTRPERMETFQTDPRLQLTQNFFIAVLFSLFVGSLVLARRNLRQGRGDRSGAFRIAGVFVAVHLFVWVLWAHHAPSRDEWSIIFLDTGYTLCFATIIWVLYVALEPLVRRRWPETLISWTRILAGRYRDPRVGRDVLVGMTCGTALAALANAVDLERWLGWASPLPEHDAVDLLHDPRYPLGSLLDTPLHAVINGMGLVFLLLLLRILLRRQWLAAGGFVALSTFLSVGGTDHPLLGLPVASVFGVAFTLLILRFGLLATIAALTCLNYLALVTTTDFSWSSELTLVVIVGLLGLTLYGFVVSLRGRQIFGGGLLEDET